MPPQFSYSQNAIIAQPGMPMDGELFNRGSISRLLAVQIPFGTYCETDANGNAIPCQDAGTAGTFKPTALGILMLSPLQEEEVYVPWSLPAALAGTVTNTNASTAITFSTAQTLPSGTMLVFSNQPGTPYFLSKALAAGTAGVLTSAFTGVGGAGKTTTSTPPQSKCPGLRAGRMGAFMREGRIWVLGDGGGAVSPGVGAAINVNHSSTGANPQGVFTFTAAQTTVGNEIDVAPGIVCFQPPGQGSTGAPVSFNDSLGNQFTTYPTEINI